jgi:hypothetical protein
MHQYVTFYLLQRHTNFVLLVSDGKELHHGILYHLCIGVTDKQAVIDCLSRAIKAGWTIEKPPRTTRQCRCAGTGEGTCHRWLRGMFPPT